MFDELCSWLCVVSMWTGEVLSGDIGVDDGGGDSGLDEDEEGDWSGVDRGCDGRSGKDTASGCGSAP